MTRDGTYSATIDHSDIRGFVRMTCLRRGAVSLYKRKFGKALFHRVNESSPDRGRVSGDALDKLYLILTALLKSGSVL